MSLRGQFNAILTFRGNFLEWELIAFPAPFKEDVWITSMEVLPGEASVVHHICFSFQKHKLDTVYNRYEWVAVPRDASGNPRPGNSGFGVLPDMRTAMRNVGSNEVTLKPGNPTLRINSDFCYIPGNSVDDYRPWNAGKLVPAGSDSQFPDPLLFRVQSEFRDSAQRR